MFELFSVSGIRRVDRNIAVAASEEFSIDEGAVVGARQIDEQPAEPVTSLDVANDVDRCSRRQAVLQKLRGFRPETLDGTVRIDCFGGVYAEQTNGFNVAVKVDD